METILLSLTDLLKWSLPAAIIGWVALRVTERVNESRERAAIASIRSKSRQDTLPTRLQAYERLVLFLERVEPNHLILRVHRPGMSAALLQSELLRAVRNEFEHNLTQQLYVSAQAWARVQESKDAVLQLIQSAGSKMGNTSTGIDLSTAMFAILGAAGVSPTQQAIEMLKNEARELL